jgi:hypothetical protein
VSTQVFAGFLIHVPEIPVAWCWAPILSFVRWAIQVQSPPINKINFQFFFKIIFYLFVFVFCSQALLINELNEQPQLRYYAAVDVLHTYGFDHYNKWTSVWILLCMAVVIRIATFLTMKYKRFGTT